jgi:hypothetical protein
MEHPNESCSVNISGQGDGRAVARCQKNWLKAVQSFLTLLLGIGCYWVKGKIQAERKHFSAKFFHIIMYGAEIALCDINRHNLQLL